MGTISKLSNKTGKTSYRAEVRKEGYRLTKCFQRRTDAKNWVTTKETQILNGQVISSFKKHTVGNAIDKYFKEVLVNKKQGTQRLHRMQLEWFKNKIGQVKLHKITPSILSELREILKTEPYILENTQTERFRGNGTVNRYFVPLLHCFKICERDWEWIDKVPRFSKLKEPLGRTRYLTPEEAKLMLSELKTRRENDIYLISYIALSFGSRLEETCALRWQDIDFENKIIYFTKTKTDHIKVLPLPERLIIDLKAWKIGNSSEYLFPPDQKSNKPYVYDKVKKKFSKIAKELGLKDVSFHNTRHTVGSWATQEGTNRKIVAELLGHQNLVTTDRYSHLDVEHLRSVVDEIAGKLH